MDNSKTVFPRQAAMLKLEQEVLSKKSKGDRITAAEVFDCTGIELDRLRGPIKTWAKRRNFVLEAVPGDGVRVLLDAETADHAIRRSKRALRQDKEALRAMTTTDASRLDDVQTRRHNFLVPRIATRVSRAEQDDRDVKRELMLTERVPLRTSKG